MQRRKFIIGVGSLAAGGAAATGTGAFSSMTSGERTVGVDVVDDASAYVALQPHDESGNAVFATGGVEFGEEGPGNVGDWEPEENKLELNFTEDNAYQAFGGKGVNPDSTYEFDNVFQIYNYGHELGPIEVWIERSEDLRADTEVSFYATGGNSDYSGSLVGEDNSQDLNNTEFVDVGVRIEAVDDVEEIEGEITVHAERV